MRMTSTLKCKHPSGLWLISKPMAIEIAQGNAEIFKDKVYKMRQSSNLRYNYVSFLCSIRKSETFQLLIWNSGQTRITLEKYRKWTTENINRERPVLTDLLSSLEWVHLKGLTICHSPLTPDLWPINRLPISAICTRSCPCSHNPASHGSGTRTPPALACHIHPQLVLRRPPGAGRTRRWPDCQGRTPHASLVGTPGCI